jgi:hypothetical protein
MHVVSFKQFITEYYESSYFDEDKKLSMMDDEYFKALKSKDMATLKRLVNVAVMIADGLDRDIQLRQLNVPETMQLAKKMNLDGIKQIKKDLENEMATNRYLPEDWYGEEFYGRVADMIKELGGSLWEEPELIVRYPDGEIIPLSQRFSFDNIMNGFRDRRTE